VNVFGNDVDQDAILGLVPDVLDRIQVWRVGRKPLHLQPRRAICKQLSGRGAMGGQAIPNQNDRTMQVTVNFSYEANEIRRPRVVIQEFVVQPQPQCPGSLCHGGKGGNTIASIPRALQWRAAARRPDAPSQWLQQIPAFIEKNQASLPFEALFLGAAKFGDARERSPLHFARGRVAPAFVGSNPADAEVAVRTGDETRRRTVARSHLAREVRSNRPEHIPNTACRGLRLPPVWCVDRQTAWAAGRDAAWLAAGSHASRPSAIGIPRKRWNRLSQPHLSTTCPARTAWLQSYGGFRAFRGFRLVSCCYCTQPACISINQVIVNRVGKRRPSICADQVNVDVCRTWFCS